MLAAEYRGPGVRNQFRDGADEYDIEVDRTRGFSVRSGRIILLGDGTEMLTEQNDDELFDHAEEDEEERQATSGPTNLLRNDREGTPGPQLQNSVSTNHDANASGSHGGSTTTTTEQSSSAPISSQAAETSTSS